MKVKVLEIRDRATMIPVFAISTDGITAEQRFLLRRVGFNNGEAVIVGFLNGERISTADEHFPDLSDGDVVDVEYILGETEKPKISERNEAHV